MANFDRDNRSHGRGDFHSRGFGGRDRGRRPMHKTVCSKCGKECEVPFIPHGDRPVFCNDCFDRNRGSNPRQFGGASSGRSNFDNKRFDKPIYSDRNDQFVQLNAKLDKIVKLLENLLPTAVSQEKVVDYKEETKIEEPIVKKEKKKKVSKKKPSTLEENKKEIPPETI